VSEKHDAMCTKGLQLFGIGVGLLVPLAIVKYLGRPFLTAFLFFLSTVLILIGLWMFAIGRAYGKDPTRLPPD
jgi:dipeptide/tripeptide permease